MGSKPLFDMIRQSYILVSERLLGSVDAIEGVDDKQRENCASSPAASLTPCPLPTSRHQPARPAPRDGDQGRKPLEGLGEHAARPSKGQLTHTDPEAFEVGRNIAVTPGKVGSARRSTS
jgi:polyhydroxyalkanoate synthase